MRIPANKAEADGVQPLSDEAVQFKMKQMAQHYDQFVMDVALGRGVKTSMVRSEAWGQGRTLTAQDAAEVGMVDRVATFQEVLKDHMSGNVKRRPGWQRVKAEDVVVPELAADPEPAPAPAPEPVEPPAPEPEPPAPVGRSRADFEARWAARFG